MGASVCGWVGWHVCAYSALVCHACAVCVEGGVSI